MNRTCTTAVTTAMAAVVALTTLLVGSAAAVDGRQPDAGGTYASDLARAYAPCTAPNTVTRDGKPACAPAVTSECRHVHGDASLIANAIGAPLGPVHLTKATTPSICADGDYVSETTLRSSGDYIGGVDEPPCPSGLCTHADRIGTFNMGTSDFFGALTGADAVVIEGNYELLGLTFVAPDGLPMAAPGIGDHPLAERFVSNLTVPIEPCTTGDFCDLAPWTSPCDFESGEVEITRTAANVADAHVTMRNVAGTSPLCRTGTYLLEATVRGTVKGCGTPADLCTLPDTTVTVPIAMKGRNLDGGGLLEFASSQQQAYDSTQILGVRVIDPTGLPCAAVGLSGLDPLSKPAVTVKGDRLRVRATIPVGLNQFSIDPAVDPGLTVTVSDRDGLVYTVTIDEFRWQLQPPIGSRWTYEDKGGVVNGVRKASVRRVTTKDAVTGYDIDLRVQGVDLSAANKASLTLGITAHQFGVLVYDSPFEWDGTRTCRGRYPKLTCK